ncbi:MAG: hypothetical protein CMK32_12395 [Porticoccaceae bacterium]|nr:hypothetical protein [Porticoccaceae bacterium]
MLRIIHLVDTKTSAECGVPSKVILDTSDYYIEYPVVMPKALATLARQTFKKILDRQMHKIQANRPGPLTESRAPPSPELTYYIRCYYSIVKVTGPSRY